MMVLFCDCAVSSSNPDPVWRPELAVDYQCRFSIDVMYCSYCLAKLWMKFCHFPNYLLLCKRENYYVSSPGPGLIRSFSMLHSCNIEMLDLDWACASVVLATFTTSHNGTLASSQQAGGSKLCPTTTLDSAGLQKRRLRKLPSAAGVRDGESCRHLRGEPEQPRGFLGRPGQKPAALVQGVRPGYGLQHERGETQLVQWRKDQCFRWFRTRSDIKFKLDKIIFFIITCTHPPNAHAIACHLFYKPCKVFSMYLYLAPLIKSRCCYYCLICMCHSESSWPACGAPSRQNCHHLGERWAGRLPNSHIQVSASLLLKVVLCRKWATKLFTALL